MIHLTDFDDAPVTPILPLSLTAVIAVRLVAQALFPGRSSRQSQVGGRHHGPTMCGLLARSASGNDAPASPTSERNANHA